MEKRHIPGKLSRWAKKRAGAAALAGGLVLLVILVGAVIGRYQRQLGSGGHVLAKEFYFTSDFLDGSTHFLAPGSNEVTFTLGNHADELRFSEVEIQYKVTVEPAEDVTVVYENPEQKLAPAGTMQDNRVTIKGLKSGETYTITATGTGGYQKTLTATVQVLPQGAGLYWHAENIPGEYTLLTVWNEGDEPGDVTIQYTGIPDNTNPNMTDWVTAAGATPIEKEISIPAHTSKVFRFFEGTVTVEGATPKVPQ